MKWELSQLADVLVNHQ
ncbi:Protein of unknown function [Bacillus mycoides]|nr:Protein of unknown function [Bacillus mycoides]